MYKQKYISTHKASVAKLLTLCTIKPSTCYECSSNIGIF